MALLNMLLPKWLLVLAVVAAGGLAAWQTHQLAGARGDLVKAQHALSAAQSELGELKTTVAQANFEAEAQAAKHQRQAMEAAHAAKERETKLRSAAAGARAESERLRDDINQLRGALARSTHEAAIERAVAIGDVLGQCAAGYQVLAERCDRHVNDLRTLIEAWPKPD